MLSIPDLNANSASRREFAERVCSCLLLCSICEGDERIPPVWLLPDTWPVSSSTLLARSVTETPLALAAAGAQACRSHIQAGQSAGAPAFSGDCWPGLPSQHELDVVLCKEGLEVGLRPLPGQVLHARIPDPALVRRRPAHSPRRSQIITTPWSATPPRGLRAAARRRLLPGGLGPGGGVPRPLAPPPHPRRGGRRPSAVAED